MAKLTAAARKKLPKEAFALPDERMFPMMDAEGKLDAEHIQMAWRMLKRAKGLSADQRKAAVKAILAAAKKAEIDTSGWTEQLGMKPKQKAEGETKTDAGMDDMDDMEMPDPEDLTVETVGGMTDAKELCAAWCLTHDVPLTSVQRAALVAAIQARCSDLNISMYSWDYYDGGNMAEMHEKMQGKAQEDAAKAAPTLESIGTMETVDELRKAYVDVREAALTAEVRDGLESAIRSRCDTVGIDFWRWQKLADTTADAAEAVQFLNDSAEGGGEVMVGPVILLDAGDPETKRPLRARFRVTRANFRNHNLRVYPLEHIQDAVAAANEDIAAGRMAPGEMYHPEAYRAMDGAVMFKSAFERQTFKWERFHLAPDGTVYGDAAILEHTPAGALIGGHIRNGVAVPVSVRWLTPNGSTVKTLSDGSKAEVPNKPLRIKTVDGVPNPATEGSESVQILDEAQVNEILAAPAAQADGAASVSGSNNPTTNDGAQGAGEEENVTKEEMRAYLATDEGKAMLREVLGVAKFDEVLQQFEAEKAENARKNAVKAILDAADLSKFDDQTKQTISDAVMSAGDATQAQAILNAQVGLANQMEARVHAARLGFGPGAHAGQVRVDSVNEGKPWRGAVEKLKTAFDDAARAQGSVPDASLRRVNAANVAKMVDLYEKDHGRMLYDSVQRAGAMGDSALVLADAAQLSMADDATTTSLVLNQPLVQLAIVEQAFQDVESAQFVTVRTDAEGGVFKIPSEFYTPAADAATNDIIVAESAAIPEANVNLVYLTFAPMWRRIATRLTQDVIRELKAGPARYDVLGRSLYHIPREKSRAVDLATYLEMTVTADEYGAVAVTDEAQTGGTAVNNTTNVKFKYTLKSIGSTHAPVVRPRQVRALDLSGAPTTTTKNDFVLKVSNVPKTRGYLDGAGNIQPSTADYAVDWEAGVIYCKAMTLNPGTVDPSCSYTYATNFDTFDLTVPSGTKAADHYNGLLTQIDTTAALMGSSPRFKKPNLAMMSLNAAVNIENAALFYKLNSPQGTELLSDQTYFGRRNSVNLAKINAPWAVGDNRIMMHQIGGTQYGVDVPFEMEGPVQSYKVNGSTVQVADEKIWYGREHSAIFTPQATNADGVVLNPYLRSIVLYRS